MIGEHLIALTAIVIGVCVPFSIPLVYMVLSYQRRRHLMELHHAERMAAIERGIEIPPLPVDLLEGRSARRPRSALLPGLVWFLVGVALLIGLWVAGEVNEGLLVGLVPAGIGLAYLIYYAVEGRKLEALTLQDAAKSQDAAVS